MIDRLSCKLLNVSFYGQQINIHFLILFERAETRLNKVGQGETEKMSITKRNRKRKKESVHSENDNTN